MLKKKKRKETKYCWLGASQGKGLGAGGSQVWLGGGGLPVPPTPTCPFHSSHPSLQLQETKLSHRFYFVVCTEPVSVCLCVSERVGRLGSFFGVGRETLAKLCPSLNVQGPGLEGEVSGLRGEEL